MKKKVIEIEEKKPGIPFSKFTESNDFIFHPGPNNTPATFYMKGLKCYLELFSKVSLVCVEEVATRCTIKYSLRIHPFNGQRFLLLRDFVTLDISDKMNKITNLNYYKLLNIITVDFCKKLVSLKTKDFIGFICENSPKPDDTAAYCFDYLDQEYMKRNDIKWDFIEDIIMSKTKSKK